MALRYILGCILLLGIVGINAQVTVSTGETETTTPLYETETNGTETEKPTIGDVTTQNSVTSVNESLTTLTFIPSETDETTADVEATETDETTSDVEATETDVTTAEPTETDETTTDLETTETDETTDDLETTETDETTEDYSTVPSSNPTTTHSDAPTPSDTSATTSSDEPTDSVTSDEPTDSVTSDAPAPSDTSATTSSDEPTDSVTSDAPAPSDTSATTSSDAPTEGSSTPSDTSTTSPSDPTTGDGTDSSLTSSSSTTPPSPPSTSPTSPPEVTEGSSSASPPSSTTPITTTDSTISTTDPTAPTSISTTSESTPAPTPTPTLPPTPTPTLPPTPTPTSTQTPGYPEEELPPIPEDIKDVVSLEIDVGEVSDCDDWVRNPGNLQDLNTQFTDQYQMSISNFYSVENLLSCGRPTLRRRVARQADDDDLFIAQSITVNSSSDTTADQLLEDLKGSVQNVHVIVDRVIITGANVSKGLEDADVEFADVCAEVKCGDDFICNPEARTCRSLCATEGNDYCSSKGSCEHEEGEPISCNCDGGRSGDRCENLGAGPIAGIVIAVLVVTGLIALLVVKMRKKTPSDEERPMTSHHSDFDPLPSGYTMADTKYNGSQTNPVTSATTTFSANTEVSPSSYQFDNDMYMRDDPEGNDSEGESNHSFPEYSTAQHGYQRETINEEEHVTEL